MEKSHLLLARGLRSRVVWRIGGRIKVDIWDIDKFLRSNPDVQGE